jgi:hypothetical protein
MKMATTHRFGMIRQFNGNTPTFVLSSISPVLAPCTDLPKVHEPIKHGKALKECWRTILSRLIMSMPQRLTAVRKARGWQTKYWVYATPELQESLKNCVLTKLCHVEVCQGG